MTDAKGPKRILAGTLLSSAGISYNQLVYRLNDGNLMIEPFRRELHSTPFIDTAAIITHDRFTPENIEEIERLAVESKSPDDIYLFIRDCGLFSNQTPAEVLSIGTQSIIIEM